MISTPPIRFPTAAKLSETSKSNASPRIAIVGGGITGLAAAHRLSKILPSAIVELFERSDRLGGVLFTRRQEGLLVERGADSFQLKLPWAFELCRELGLEPEIVPTNEERRRALVVRDGQLYPVPEGFVVIRAARLGPTLRSPLLSLRGKIRLLCERWIPRAKGLDQASYDESVAAFALRRLGRETFEQLVQPLLAGIYTADPEKLSLAATMPGVLEDERKHGSLRKASLALQATSVTSETLASGARYASFVSLQGGLQRLVDALAEHLRQERVHFGSAVASITKTSAQRWNVNLADGSCQGPFDGVVVALPAPRAAEVIFSVDARLGELLQSIEYASSVVVCMTLNRSEISKPLEGFGIVVPTVEGRSIVAASFSSLKFPGRAADDLVLVRVFLGGALRPEIVDLSDAELQELAASELSDLVGAQGKPVVVDIVRWREKMPQYHVGHVQLVDAIEQQVEKHEGLELAGNAYRGVGIPQCVLSGEEAARRLSAALDHDQSN